ncbi:c-type cytochrome [Rosettibacter firmus]|uniref:c-type cytochrome n=1 Tax=Rosettibacter firmus TaxID=3111522 RepID=UPI00336C01F1
MELIDKIILPQSAQHLLLLKYILVLTFILFISYASLLFGSFILSIIFEQKSKKQNNLTYKKVSIELIDLITFNKGIAFSLGIIPLLSSAFCYAQLLHLSGLIVTEAIFISTFLFFLALISIYTYKHAIHIKNALDVVKDYNPDGSESDVRNYLLKSSKIINASKILGLIFILLSTYLFIASVEFTQNPEKWTNSNNYSGVIFSFNAFINYIQFILISLGFTSLIILTKNRQAIEQEESYKNFIHNFSLKLGLISTITLPVIITITVITKSKYSLSYNLFSFTLIALILILFVSILLYVMLKQGKINYNFISILLFVLIIAFLIIKDQYAFNIAAKKQFVQLAANYESYQKKLLEETGLLKETISGEEIFNSKCIACHQFDKKVVGPPYNEVLPKYEGKMDELINFILNPVKVNPDYPSMPNQGLKPKEAEAVANYIMNTYKK